jgi:hypothetical protein
MSAIAASLPLATEPAAPPAPDAAAAMNPRTRRLLQGAIVPTLLAMAWPNILVMTAQASTGLIETWWVSRLGTDALAGLALAPPGHFKARCEVHICSLADLARGGDGRSGRCRKRSGSLAGAIS